MELNNESKTLFIPLLGKAVMSRDNLFLHDPKAEEIISKTCDELLNNYGIVKCSEKEFNTKNEVY